jgi:hypothetical protein
MMTLILIFAFVLIAFVGLLRYDMHKYKYAPPKKNDDPSQPDSATANKETQRDSDK